MDVATVIDPALWVKHTFAQVKLGDKRLEQRLMKLATQMVQAPELSLPKQVHKHWGQLKAGYRLFANQNVTFEALSLSQWLQTKAEANQQEGTVLMVQDTTELDSGYRSATTGLGSVGNGTHRGFLLQTVLAVNSTDRHVMGIAAQEPFVREAAPRSSTGKKESSQQRKDRKRESEVWLRGIRAVGSPTGSARLVHVGDSYADMFAFYQQCKDTGTDFVVRAYQDRVLSQEPEDAQEPGANKLLQRARSLPSQGCRTIEVHSEHERKARNAKMNISFQKMQLEQTSSSSHRLANPKKIPVWVVRVWEVDPPLKEVGERARKASSKHKRKSHATDEEHVVPLEWILVSSVPVTNEEQAWERVKWYGYRWVVEEYHHGLKTGCGIEKRHLGEQESIERILGVLAPMAVRLLQLRELLTWTPQEPARLWFSREELFVISRTSEKEAGEWTVEQVVREIASWGGFLGRKSDGQPGWMSVWAGWERLNLLVQGVRMAQASQKNGIAR